MATLKMTIKGMHCESCIKLIKMNFEDLNGIKNSSIDLKSGRASVDFDEGLTNKKEIAEAVRKAGYSAELN